uniref:Uncharacterized protein n=1 Tax=Knipowitschia caucasica TaxID=637954 RepID=A0AAV2KD83_KNICA
MVLNITIEGCYHGNLEWFLLQMVASAIYYGAVCWAPGSTERDRSRLNKLVRRASSTLGCSLDSVEEVRDRRVLAKATSIMNNTSHCTGL